MIGLEPFRVLVPPGPPLLGADASIRSFPIESLIPKKVLRKHAAFTGDSSKMGISRPFRVTDSFMEKTLAVQEENGKLLFGTMIQPRSLKIFKVEGT